MLAAGGGSEPERSAALETLCRTYWEPIYTFLRCRGLDAHDAQDATQDFFAHLLEKNRLQGVAPERGRFRSFLLTALKNYLNDARDRARATKRGGGQGCLPLEVAAVEASVARDAVGTPPEHQFDRRWAGTVLSRAFMRLQQEFTAAGKEPQLLELAVFLGVEGSAAEYDAAAAKLSTTRGAVAVAVFRLRQRYGDLVRCEIANTVATASELQEELRYLLEIACQ